MYAAENGCDHIVRVLADPHVEINVKVDLDKQDSNGDTALIRAAQNYHKEVVKLLLEKGASVMLRNDLGFSALHATVYQAFRDRNKYLNDVIREEILLQLINFCPDSTVNALDFCGNTFLDLAMKSSITITKETQIIFRERGCVLNTMSESEGETIDEEVPKCLNSNYNEQLWVVEKEVIYRRISNDTNSTMQSSLRAANRLHTPMTDEEEICRRISEDSNFLGYRPYENPRNLLTMIIYPMLHVEKERRKVCTSLSRDQFLDMVKTKADIKETSFHKVVFNGIYEHLFDDFELYHSQTRLSDWAHYTENINAPDEFGRTPLHYASSYLGRNHKVSQWLEADGADKEVKDFHGFSSEDYFRFPSKLELLPNKTRLYRGVCDSEKFSKFQSWAEFIYHSENGHVTLMHIRKRKRLSGAKTGKSISWKFWKEAEYAFKFSFSKSLSAEVTQFFKQITDAITLRDSRFECTVVPDGSSCEGTKIDLPDEHDFNLILTKFSKICEVHVAGSPVVPKGYVQLIRKTHSNNTVDCQGDENFEEFLNSSGFLQCVKVFSCFQYLLYQTLAYFTHHLFQWDLQHFKNLNSAEVFTQSRLFLNFNLRMIRPFEGILLPRISVDVVPCIHIDGWWPDGAIQDGLADQKVKAEGCNLVFDQPQRKYPWVPYSEPYAMISFALSESAVIRDSPLTLKAAYMVAKHLYHAYGCKNLSHLFKTALLFCIHDDKRRVQENNKVILNYDDITPEDLDSSMIKLMSCVMKFLLQGYYPSLFMPSFNTPIETLIKYLRATGKPACIPPDNNGIGFYPTENFFEILDSMALFLPPEVEMDFDVHIPRPFSEDFDLETLSNY